MPINPQLPQEDTLPDAWGPAVNSVFTEVINQGNATEATAEQAAQAAEAAQQRADAAWSKADSSGQGPAGPAGPAGPTGPAGPGGGSPGADGATWFTGAGAPGTIVGQKDTDLYLNTTTSDVYKRVSSSWGSPIANIKGAAGTNGTNGTNGATGAAGAAGAAGTNGKTVLSGTSAPTGGTGTDGDFYFRTSTSDMYGPKAAGAWPAPVNLVGAEGPQGPAGADGAAATLGTNYFIAYAVPPADGDNTNLAAALATAPGGANLVGVWRKV